jgi:hypothetical protein
MNPKAQLKSFMARFTPEVETLAKRVLARMSAQFPNAIQMVYDNYNFLVIGFSPTERPSEAIFSIVLSPRNVSLCFLLSGTKLSDPKKLLRGSGNRVRNIRLENATTLDQPDVRSLISQALKLAPVPFNRGTAGRLVIRSVSAKQRPRRPKT